MKKKYVKKICRLIHKTGMSIFNLAIEIEASPQSIYKWMSGQSLPSCEHILRLLDLVNGESDEA